MSAWNALKADTHRQRGHFSLKQLIASTLTQRTFRPILTMRLCQGISESTYPFRITLPFFQALHRITCHMACIDLPWRTEIAGGLIITHGWGLVINQEAKIGSNVTLFHGATLGRRDRIAPNGDRMTEYPTIGNDVWIGPHAIIVGGVTIGEGSRIAGGSFVSQDVPPFSVVVGNPSFVAKENCTPDVINKSKEY